MYYVYLHKNPITKEPFYVGCGNKKRPTFFFNRDNYWKEYVKLSGIPIVEILRIVETKEEAFKLEFDYIEKYKRIIDGGCLINKSKGGKGPNGVYPNEITRKKLSTIRTGKVFTEEFKNKLSQSAKNSIKVKHKIEVLTENKKRIILDKSNGVFYHGVKDAADAYGVKQGTLTHRLNGRLLNNTSLMYV